MQESHSPTHKKNRKIVRIAENVGDAMIFWIWTENTEKLIARSVIKDAEDPKHVNMRAELMGKEGNKIPQHSGHEGSFTKQQPSNH